MHMIFGIMLLQCTIVYFDSAESLDAVIEITPVLKETNLCWSCFVLAKCAGCEKLGHTLLACHIGEKKNKTLSNSDKSRLAAIYAKCSAPVAHSVSFGAGSSLEMKPIPWVSLKLNDRFVTFEHSLTSFAERVDMLAKRLNTSEPTVSQLSPGWANIVMSEGLGVATGDETVVEAVVFDPTVISRLKKTLNNLLITVMNLSAKMDNADLDDIICWHKKKNNLVSIFMKSKLKGKICTWIVNKFDGVQVFISGLESSYLGASVVVVMNSSLARHVCKISKMLGWLLFIKLLFKNKLSVSILGLYTSVFSVAQFFQAGNINSLIAKAVNKFFFVILGGDFNEDSSHKCASFKKCLDFGLVNALGGSSCIVKTINYVLISSNLVNAMVGYSMFGIGKYFDTNYQTVLVLVGLGGLLDNYWKYNCKGADDIKWAKFKDDMVVNAAMLYDDFLVTGIHLDLDAMWVAFHKVLCLSAKAVFKKKWFKNYDYVFVKKSSKFHKLELLVSKLVKMSRLDFFGEFTSLFDKWKSLDSVNASVMKKLYHFSKISEAERIRKSRIRLAIDKRIKSFKLNKDYTIRSVLKHLFYKVTLDYLVMDNELVLESDLVRAKVNPLEYIFDDAFSDVMCSIEFDEMFGVISNLSDGKVAGLSGISNKL
ncbi:hypothetical protein G9A89_007562 [Geosiphon pyriformis]|nr:hypothetical protein G9A89_007562 [Geosiphon pyriformis]